MSKIPQIKVRKAGRVSETLEGLADAYRAQNPQMDCRFVYDPKHKPELSGVMGRLAQGYRKVRLEELGEFFVQNLEGGESNQDVRVGDLVLMGISREEKQELQKELVDLAKAEIQSIDQKYQQSIEKINEELGLLGNRQGRPIGRSIIEEKEFEFEYTQKESAE